MFHPKALLTFEHHAKETEIVDGRWPPIVSQFGHNAGNAGEYNDDARSSNKKLWRDMNNMNAAN